MSSGVQDKECLGMIQGVIYVPGIVLEVGASVVDCSRCKVCRICSGSALDILICVVHEDVSAGEYKDR